MIPAGRQFFKMSGSGNDFVVVDARQTAAVEVNVLVQLDNVRTHPAVAAALAREQVNLHAWVYEIETGKVFAYDSPAGQFMPIENTGHGPRPHYHEIEM